MTITYIILSFFVMTNFVCVSKLQLQKTDLCSHPVLTGSEQNSRGLLARAFRAGEKPDYLCGLIYIHYGYNMVCLMLVTIAWKPATVSLLSLALAGSAFQVPSRPGFLLLLPKDSDSVCNQPSSVPTAREEKEQGT